MKIKDRNNKLIAKLYIINDDGRINNLKVKRIVEKTIKKCSEELPLFNKKIVIFKTRNEFVKIHMNGVTGNSFYENTIVLEIFPIKNWEKELINTLAHEYSHLAFLEIRKQKKLKLIDSLIFEGIAETFREEIFKGKTAKWSKALTRKEAKKLFGKIKDKLKSENYTLYKNLFFGSKEYKRWSGYSLGYYIVKVFRKNHQKISWKEFIKIPPKEILRKSGFIKS